jgi:hypothetical protein
MSPPAAAFRAFAGAAKIAYIEVFLELILHDANPVPGHRVRGYARVANRPTRQ